MTRKNMTLTDIEKSSKHFKDTHDVSVSGFDDKGNNKITAAYVLSVTTKLINKLSLQMQKQIQMLNDKIDTLSVQMHKGFKQINNRIDNLVAKNNLKE